jgi:hypothetical protein
MTPTLEVALAEDPGGGQKQKDCPAQHAEDEHNHAGGGAAQKFN